MKHSISRQSQQFYIPIGPDVTNTSGYIMGRPQSPCRAGRLIIESAEKQVLINDIVVGGVSMNGTRHPVRADIFFRDSRYDGQDFMGIPLARQQDISIEFAGKSVPAAHISAAVMCDPLPEDQLPVLAAKEYPEFSPFYWGIPETTIPLGSKGEVAFSVQKAGTLGMLVLRPDDTSLTDSLRLSEVLVNGEPQQNGRSTESVSAYIFARDNDDVDGKSLNIPVVVNDRVTLIFENVDVIDHAIGGLFFANITL